jgi:phosphoribosyl-ATP pyrophosphohydrolase
MSLGRSEKLGLILNALAETVDARAEAADEASSYTAKLLSKGPERTAKKLGEEAVELAIALVGQSDDDVIGETADLLFHLLVALRSRNISLDQVAETLADRQGISGLVEKASRTES